MDEYTPLLPGGARSSGPLPPRPRVLAAVVGTFARVVTHKNFTLGSLSVGVAATVAAMSVPYVTGYLRDRGSISAARAAAAVRQTQRVSVVAVGVLSVLALLGYTLSNVGAPGIQPGTMGFLTQPAVIFTLVNVLVFMTAIHPRFVEVRAELRKDLPNYTRATGNTMLARFVALAVVGAVAGIMMWRLLSVDLTPGRVFAALGLLIGVLTLASNIVESYAETARLVLFSETGWQPEATVVYLDRVVNGLMFDFLRKWLIPLGVAALVVLLHRKSVGLLGVANYVYQNFVRAP